LIKFIEQWGEGTNKKTAIRDFEELIKTGFVVKVGVKKGTYYAAKEHVPKRCL
jgi:hypothetical protein